jgi:diguanylate cyclase
MTTNKETANKSKLFIQEINNILSKVTLSKEQKFVIDKLLISLQTKPEPKTVFNTYKKIIEILIENIESEKNSPQAFLKTLNHSLHHVKDVVNGSIQEIHEQKKHKDSIDLSILNNIENIDDTLTNHQDLSKIRYEINQQLSELRRAVKNKSAIEHQEQNLLKNTIEQMRKELRSVTSHANTYKKKLDQQKQLTMIDPLTQLPNRFALEKQMSVEYLRSKADKDGLWIAIADIDHFKKINDNYGHSSGDKTLHAVAKTIKNLLRDRQFAARYGGEEFVILLPNLKRKTATSILDSINQQVKKIQFIYKQHKINISISIGATAVKGNESMLEAFDRADKNLYSAKDKGRDCIVMD